MKAPLKLLIVEDNEADLFLIRKALEASGLEFEAEFASNGEKALAVISRLAGSGRLDGMILDLNLTTHSGIDILRRVRGTPSLASIRVVILTSSNSPADRRDAEMLGTDAYIPKPMDLDEFMEVGKKIALILTATGDPVLFGPEAASAS